MYPSGYTNPQVKGPGGGDCQKNRAKAAAHSQQAFLCFLTVSQPLRGCVLTRWKRRRQQPPPFCLRQPDLTCSDNELYAKTDRPGIRQDRRIRSASQEVFYRGQQEQVSRIKNIEQPLQSSPFLPVIQGERNQTEACRAIIPHRSRERRERQCRGSSPDEGLRPEFR